MNSLHTSLNLPIQAAIQAISCHLSHTLPKSSCPCPHIPPPHFNRTTSNTQKTNVRTTSISHASLHQLCSLNTQKKTVQIHLYKRYRRTEKDCFENYCKRSLTRTFWFWLNKNLLECQTTTAFKNISTTLKTVLKRLGLKRLGLNIKINCFENDWNGIRV